MTDPEKKAVVKETKKEASPEVLSGRIRLFLFSLFFLIALAFGAALHSYVPMILGETERTSDTARLDALDLRLKGVEGQFARLSQSGGVKADGEAALAGPDSQDIQMLKEGLAGLSGALGMFQTELEKSSQTTNVVREQAQMGVATVLAFVQMQNAAQVGHVFEKERQALRALAGEDQTMIDLLMKLEKPALQGVPEVPKLQQEWRDLAGEAQTALRKTAAHTWQDRIVVALEGLVSVRALNPKPGETMSFAAIDMDLGRGDLAAALDKAAALPEEVQKIIAPWRAKAEMRRDMEKTIGELATHLIVREEIKEKEEAAAAAAPTDAQGAQPDEGKKEPAAPAKTRKPKAKAKP